MSHFKAVGKHLLKGIIGALAFAAAIRWLNLIWPPVILFPIALLAWRGCPTCWLAGFPNLSQSEVGTTCPLKNKPR